MGQLLFISFSGGGGGSSGAISSIIWRPGGISSGNVVATYAEVDSAILASLGDIIVQVDTSLAPAIVPSTADTECYGRVTFSPYTFNISSGPSITVADGGRLRNLFTVRGLGISGAPTVRPFLYQDIAGTLLICREGGQITLDAGATVSAVELAANACEVALFEGATLNNASGNPALSTVQVNSGFTAFHAIISLAGTPGPPAYPANTFSGDETTTLLQIFDSSAAQVTQPNFLGAVLGLPMSFAGGTQYDDTLVPVPSLGVSNVQAAIDVLKVQVAALVPGSYRRSFVDADLVAGILTVVHNLGVRYNTWAIYDNNNSAVLNPDSAFDIDGNTITFDLSTYQLVNGGAIPGTWNIVVQS